MEGGCLVLGVEDKSLKILGIQDFHTYTPENFPGRILGNCTSLASEGLWVESITTSDSKKTIWIVHDLDYARVLAKHPSLTLIEITMLDKVQKKKSLNEEEIRERIDRRKKT